MARKQLTRAQKKRHLEAAGWILRSKEPGRGSEAALLEWLDRDPENASAYEAARRLMGEARMAIESDAALRDVRAGRQSSVKPVIGSLLALFVAGSAFLLFDGPMRLKADVIARTASMPVVELEDGSTVQLNASSALAHDFDASRRIVTLLRGQAFFDVAGDPARPFMVEAGDVRVTALGTAFDVRLGDDETDVTVTHNAVLIEFADKDSLQVEEGSRIVYDRSTRGRTVSRTDSMLALAWRRGQLAVDNAPLSFVVEEISRHFAGKIVIAGNQLATRRVSGTLTISDTESALAFIEQALDVRINKIGPLIVIRD